MCAVRIFEVIVGVQKTVRKMDTVYCSDVNSIFSPASDGNPPNFISVLLMRW